jgi:hypothetical protein
MVMLVSVKTRVRATSEAVVGDAETQHRRHWACPFASYAHRGKKKKHFFQGTASSEHTACYNDQGTHHYQGTHSKRLLGRDSVGRVGQGNTTSYSRCGVPPAQLAHL